MRWLWITCLFACGAPSRPQLEPSVDGWLAQHTRPLIRVEATRVVLVPDAGPPEERSLETPEMAALARRIALPFELHRVLLLRTRPVLTASEAEGLENRRLVLVDEADPLAKQAALLIEAVVRSGAIDGAQVVDALRAMRPLIEEKASALARLRLEALHAITRDFYQRLPPEARVMLRVEVVDGPAQRLGHWAVQYFERALAVEGEGARILYVEQPLATIDAWVLDEAAGRDIFEDPQRLRRDLGAEGARDWLDHRGLDLVPRE